MCQVIAGISVINKEVTEGQYMVFRGRKRPEKQTD